MKTGARRLMCSLGPQGPLLAVTAASVLLSVQLQSRAQNAREQPTLDAKMHVVQNSTSEATTNPIQTKGDQVVNIKHSAQSATV
jgi:hypothetical protein